jgi:ornithine--oxo-acid transaminase
LGSYLYDKLKTIKSPLIKEIRGKGLFIGVEIDPKKAKARDVCLKLLEEGILSKETHATVIRLAPPLVITKEQIDFSVEKINHVLTHM